MMDEKWQPIATAPRFMEKSGNIPVEFLVLLHDPDNEITYRVQMGFWNSGLNQWEPCDSTAEVKRPTHWMPLPPPPKQGS